MKKLKKKRTGFSIYCGTACDVLSRFSDSSIDAVVTDPPYGLQFMGKKWDYKVPSVETWREVLRVLKPGGHLLSFSSTRTQHRACVNIEDAGFEIRDMIAWVYGSGFPKSHDVGKAIDKEAGVERETIGSKVVSCGTGEAFGKSAGVSMAAHRKTVVSITAPTSAAARQWDGWGTALKPAMEPICVARKPFKGAVAANVLEHGTGAINVDGCRVPGIKPQVTQGINSNPSSFNVTRARRTSGSPDVGRWPSNLIHDGSEEVLALFPVNATISAGTRGQGGTIYGGGRGYTAGFTETGQSVGFGDIGSAARFFYCAKASKKDRGKGNSHPTVKPTRLMRYLCRLVTPPGGVILDPFVGSGSTGKAALIENFCFVGIDYDEDAVSLSRARLLKVETRIKNRRTLFSELM